MKNKRLCGITPAESILIVIAIYYWSQVKVAVDLFTISVITNFQLPSPFALEVAIPLPLSAIVPLSECLCT
ncbi:hypothetical protein [Paenibacillus illinoisensis]|uniref:hypothetical protein n=1 Tax=Paenibacillus illinoisensis TaxID=59845 RepID=UPI0011B5EA64|nr:hypothetical protein [Paenibacillus illinoisensis]